MVQSSTAFPIAPGEILAGKFRVERVLGMGGMGVVVAARHIELDEQVAIKFLLPQTLNNVDASNRFAKEARAAVKIKSQHVVRTFDVGRLENGAPYIVMEYLEGMDLASRLRDHGPLSIEDAVTFTLQTCEALADAHAVGIIHRDLKPANLFVTRATDGTDCIKVLDFGISKIMSGSGSTPSLVATSTTAMMGSPLYMAPEQMTSARSVDARCDVWSLGVTLYELLCGVQPFVAENIAELCSKVTSAPQPSVREQRPEVPAGLEAIINRCLEKDRERRYLNVAELALALVEFAPRRSRHSAERASLVLAAAGLSASAIQLPPSTDPNPKAVPSGESQIVSAWGNTKPPPRRRIGVLAGCAALGISMLGGAAFVLLRRDPIAVAPAGSSALTTSVVAVPSVLSKPTDPVVTLPESSGDAASDAKPSPTNTIPRDAQARPMAHKPAPPANGRSSPKSTTQLSAKPVTSSRLPDLGGKGREY